MPDPLYSVEGLDRLARTLKKCGADVSDLKDAHQRAGNIVAGAAKGIAPRRSGDLANSIRSARQARRVRVMAGNNTRVPYAAVIGWGFPARHIEANPFLSEAARSSEPRWFHAYVDDVTAAINKVKGA